MPINLPEWATLKSEGPPHVIDVDAHAAYEALLGEYADLYGDTDKLPPEMRTKDGAIKKEWADALDDLASETPSAYWCEVAYQSIKLDLQMACRTFALSIHIHDPGKRYRQADRAEGRGTDKAAGGFSGGREAREHYRRLRGFLPA